MAVAFLTPETKAAWFARIDGIQESTPARWGTMDAIRMFRHLLEITRISLEEAQTEDHGNFFVKNVMRYLAFHTPMPWPQGKIQTAPGLAIAPEGDFTTTKQALKDAVGRFLDAAAQTPDRETLHPAFGMRKLAYWQRLHGCHFDHHLKQFGV